MYRTILRGLLAALAIACSMTIVADAHAFGHHRGCGGCGYGGYGYGGYGFGGYYGRGYGYGYSPYGAYNYAGPAYGYYGPNYGYLGQNYSVPSYQPASGYGQPNGVTPRSGQNAVPYTAGYAPADGRANAAAPSNTLPAPINGSPDRTAAAVGTVNGNFSPGGTANANNIANQSAAPSRSAPATTTEAAP